MAKYGCLGIFLFLVVTRIYALPTTNSGACTSGSTKGASTAQLSSGSSYDVNIAFGYLAETPEYTFECCGKITHWKFKSAHQGTISLQTWRRTAADSFKMIGENYYSVTTVNTVITFEVPENERIVVLPGDMIGWRSAGEEMIVYEAAAHFTESSYPNLFRRINTEDLHPGDTYDWNSIESYNDRWYSVQATYATSSAPSFSGVANVNVAEAVGTGTSVTRFGFSDTDTAQNSSLNVVQTASLPYYTVDMSSGIVTSNPQYRVRTGDLSYGVYDACYQYGSDSHTLTLQSEALTFANLPATISVEERATAQTLLYTVTVSDPVDQIYCTHAWPDFYPFFIAGTTNAGNTEYGLYLTESPGLVYSASPYTLDILCYSNTVTGILGPVTGTITVLIIPNTKPSITNLDATATIDALTAYVGDTVFTVTASDPESDELTYTLSCTPSGGPFLMMKSGHIQLTELLLHHSSKTYNCEVSVSDGLATDGSNFLHIDILNVNDPPIINNKPATDIRVKENTPLNTIIYRFTFEDLDASDSHIYTLLPSDLTLTRMLSIDKTGNLTTAYSVINYEDFGSHTFTLSVKVTDYKIQKLRSVTLEITDENEAPYFPHDDYDVNADEGTDGTALTYQPTLTVVDVDAGDTTTFQLDCDSTTNTYRFNVDASSGALSYKGDYDLDVTGTPTDVTCTLTVTDKYGLSDTTTVNIHINYANEFSPTFQLASYSFYADMSMLVGTSIFRLSASDRDVNVDYHGHITYSLDQSGLSSVYFAIDNNGDVYIAKQLPGTDLTFSAKAENKFASTVLSEVAPITVYIPSTTTQGTSTTTDRKLGFTESYPNVIWLTLAVGGAAGVLVALAIALFRVIRHNTPRIFVDGFWCCKRKLLPHEIGFGDPEYDLETFGRPHQYDEDDPQPPDAWYRQALQHNVPKRVYSAVGPEKVHLTAKNKRAISPQPDDSVSQVGSKSRNVSFSHSGQRYSGPNRNNQNSNAPLYEMFRVPSKEEPRQWTN